MYAAKTNMAIRRRSFSLGLGSWSIVYAPHHSLFLSRTLLQHTLEKVGVFLSQENAQDLVLTTIGALLQGQPLIGKLLHQSFLGFP
jgi:hypothetical protein